MASMQTPDAETRELRCSEFHHDDNQSKNCPRADNTLLLEPRETPRHPCRVGPTVLGHEPTVAPCAWQGNNAPLCCFTQTLSLRSYAAPETTLQERL